VLLCYSPVVFAILAVVFFSLLFTTRYVSLSSMVTAVVAVIASIVSGDKIFIIAMCLLAGMVIYKHRANIGRIINKTEPKANFSKKQK
jgi:glycerol-3-phosphate acyltransferase PlsY